MCYSAQVKADWRRLSRQFGAQLSLADFIDLYATRRNSTGTTGTTAIKTPRALDMAFESALADPASWEDIPGVDREGLETVVEHIVAWRGTEITRLEQELFAQRKRLADAERALETKATKAATESKRIATAKVRRALARLADLNDLKRSGAEAQFQDSDSRIFPGVYAPVIVVEDGVRVIKPMRYGCRPAGKPAFYDRKYPGTYNARRDNLEGFWKSQFGRTHGLIVVDVFYENVNRDGENVVLQFRPQDRQPMLVACLWSHWTPPSKSASSAKSEGESTDANAELESELLSFAAITDEPPPEVAAAGHDRCIVSLRQENVDAWLNPLNPEPGSRHNLEAQQLLENKHETHYEHRLAA